MPFQHCLSVVQRSSCLELLFITAFTILYFCLSCIPSPTPKASLAYVQFQEASNITRGHVYVHVMFDLLKVPATPDYEYC